MNRRALLVAAALAAAQAPQAIAAERDATLSGRALAVERPCARHVEIAPDAALDGKIAVHAQADHQEELDQLLLDPGRIHTPELPCWAPANAQGEFQPTLVLTIHVPANMALSIEDGGAAGYVIGPVDGSLTVELSGGASLAAATAHPFSLEASGASHLRIDTVRGAAKLELSGSPELSLGRVDLATLAASLSGAGRLTIQQGKIGSLTLEQSGTGGTDIGASITGQADIEMSGAGSLHLAKPPGSLHKEINGAGTVSVGD